MGGQVCGWVVGHVRTSLRDGASGRERRAGPEWADLDAGAEAKKGAGLLGQLGAYTSR
jgi:hypothetical protein